MSEHLFPNLKLKETRFLKNQVWLRRFPRPSIKELMVFFSYLENCSISGRKCQFADLTKSDVGFNSELPGLSAGINLTLFLLRMTRFF